MYANLGQTLYRLVSVPRKVTPGHQGCTMRRPHLFGRALICPGHFGAMTFGLFGYPSSLSKSARFFSLAEKALLFSISNVILLLWS